MKKILVIMAEGGIGDCILATAVIRALKEDLKPEFLAVLAGYYIRDIIDGNPFVEEIITDIDPSDKSRKAPFFYLLNKIKSYNFDVAVILWSSYRVAWLAYLAGIPVRVGQDFRLLYSFLYTHRVPLRTLLGDMESHWVECLLDFARRIGAGKGEPAVFLPVSEKHKQEIRELLKTFKISDEDLLIGIHPARGIDISRVDWPHKIFARTGDALAERFNARVVFTGGKGEIPLVEKIVSSMNTSPLNMAGKCDLKQLIAIIDRCNLFISVDSGPMHIAAACGIPLVAIFALKSDMPNRWKPYKTRHIIVRKDVFCPERCIKEKCRKFTCMHELEPEDILEPVRILLEEKYPTCLS